jgi:hypothetical protein
MTGPGPDFLDWLNARPSPQPTQMEANTMTTGPAAGFEPGPANPQPHTILTYSTPNDPHDFLPPGSPQKKWTTVVQRTTDLHTAIPMGETVREAADAVTVLQRRISDLTRLKSEGGFGLSEDAGTVITERKKLERAISERDRQRTLYQDRGARWNICAQLRGAIRDWVIRGGIPGGCVLEVVEDLPISELVKKGETIATAVERYRRSGSEVREARLTPAPATRPR